MCVVDEIKQMESAWGDAFERGDLAALDRFMADEYTLTDPLGNVSRESGGDQDQSSSF